MPIQVNIVIHPLDKVYLYFSIISQTWNYVGNASAASLVGPCWSREFTFFLSAAQPGLEPLESLFSGDQSVGEGQGGLVCDGQGAPKSVEAQGNCSNLRSNQNYFIENRQNNNIKRLT